MLNMWAHEDCLLSLWRAKLVYRLDNSLRMAIVFQQAFMGWALWEGKGAMQFRDFKGGRHHNGLEDLNLTPKNK